MDDVVNRMARELSDAIAAALAEDARVEACRERARAAGFEMKLSLEAIIGFVNRHAAGRDRRRGRAAAEGAHPSSAAHVRDQRQRSALPPLAADRRRRDPEKEVE